jgi:Leucine-rich repeat (LRR) protein
MEKIYNSCMAAAALLHGETISDDWLNKLVDITDLYLSGTQVFDVSGLAGCAALKTLFLNGTQVVDVSGLAGCAALETLSLNGTQVVDVSGLKKALPKLTIYQ